MKHSSPTKARTFSQETRDNAFNFHGSRGSHADMKVWPRTKYCWREVSGGGEQPNFVPEQDSYLKGN